MDLVINYFYFTFFLFFFLTSAISFRFMILPFFVTRDLTLLSQMFVTKDFTEVVVI